MSPRRSLVVLMGLGVSILAAAVALAVQTLAHERVSPPLAPGPTAGTRSVDGTEPGTPPPADAPASAQDARDPGAVSRLTVTVEQRAHYVDPGRDALGDALRIEVVDGADEVLEGADARLVAGPATVDPAATGRQLVEVVVHRAGPGQGTFHRVVPRTASAGDDGGPAMVVGLGRPEVAEGRVSTEDGAPVSGARVWAGTSRPGGEPVVVETDADGRFRIEALPLGGGIPLMAAAPGHVPGMVLAHFTGGGADLPTLRLEKAAAPVEIRLVGRAVDPAAGRVLVAPAPSARSVSTRLRRVPFLAAALPRVRAALFGPGGGAGAYPLDAHGRAVAEDLPAGLALTAWAEHPDLVAGAGRRFTPHATRAERVVVRAVPETGAGAARTAAAVSGSVVDSAGRPVADATVRLAPDPRRAVPAALTSRAFVLPEAMHRGAEGVVQAVEADGSFRLVVEAGDLAAGTALLVQAPGRASAVVPVPASAGPAGAAVGTVVLPAPGAFAAASGADRLELVSSGPVRTVELREPGSAWRLWHTAEPFVLRRFDRPGAVRLVLQETDADGPRVLDVPIVGPTRVDVDGGP